MGNCIKNQEKFPELKHKQGSAKIQNTQNVIPVDDNEVVGSQNLPITTHSLVPQIFVIKPSEQKKQLEPLDALIQAAQVESKSERSEGFLSIQSKNKKEKQIKNNQLSLNSQSNSCGQSQNKESIENCPKSILSQSISGGQIIDLKKTPSQMLGVQDRNSVFSETLEGVRIDPTKSFVVDKQSSQFNSKIKFQNANFKLANSQLLSSQTHQYVTIKHNESKAKMEEINQYELGVNQKKNPSQIKMRPTFQQSIIAVKTRVVGKLEPLSQVRGNIEKSSVVKVKAQNQDQGINLHNNIEQSKVMIMTHQKRSSEI